MLFKFDSDERRLKFVVFLLERGVDFHIAHYPNQKSHVTVSNHLNGIKYKELADKYYSLRGY